MARQFAQKKPLSFEPDVMNNDSTSGRDHQSENKTAEWKPYSEEGHIHRRELDPPAIFGFQGNTSREPGAAVGAAHHSIPQQHFGLTKWVKSSDNCNNSPYPLLPHITDTFSNYGNDRIDTKSGSSSLADCAAINWVDNVDSALSGSLK